MTSSTICNDIYQFLHIRIEIIHGSHMYILFLPRYKGPTRGKKQYIHMASMNYFLNYRY